MIFYSFVFGKRMDGGEMKAELLLETFVFWKGIGTGRVRALDGTIHVLWGERF